MAKNVKVKIPPDLGGGEMDISSKDLTPEMEDVLKGGAGDTGVPDDDKEERGRVNRGNSTDMESEPLWRREKAAREERRKYESEQRVAKARRAAEKRKEEAGQQVSEAAEPGKETGVGEGEEIHTDDLGEYAKGKQTEDAAESHPEEEKSGSDQSNTELVDAITEGNNAIIGELAQLLQAINGLTSEIRGGISVKM